MKTRVSLVAALLLSIASFAQAQKMTTTAQMPGTLTLDDALRIARENNPDYIKVQNDPDVAAAQVRRSWAALLPNVNTSLGFNGVSSTTYTAVDPFGQPLSQPVAVTTKSSGASQGANMNFTLFDGGRMFRDMAASRAQARSVDATVHSQLVSLDARVARQYFLAAQAERTEEVERRTLAAARDRLDRLQQSFRLASSTQVDLLGAQQSVIREERQLAGFEKDARKQKLSLAQQLGIAGSPDFELTGDLPEAFDPSATLNADALVAQALSSSPTILQRQAAYAATKAQASGARGARLPTISGGVSYGRSASERGYGAWGELNPQNHSFGFNMNVSFPLFTRFQTSASIAQAAAAEEDAAQDLRSARIQVETDVRSALLDLIDAYRGLTANEEIARLTGQRLELAEERYRNGAQDMGFIQLQQVVDENANAQQQAVIARFNFLTQRVNLEERLGAPLAH